MSPRLQSTIPQRHGTAVEHIPQSQPGISRPPKPSPGAVKEAKKGDTGGEPRQPDEELQAKGTGSYANADDAAKAATSSTKKDADTLPERIGRKPVDTDHAAAGGSSNPPPADSATVESQSQPSSDSTALQTVADSHPLETVLHLESPATSRAEGRRKTPPHLEPAPYVHHFDTYTLVKDLGKGGFTQDQSVTIMKAVRSLLAVNLDIAKEGLVSKSDVENVCHPQISFASTIPSVVSALERA